MIHPEQDFESLWCQLQREISVGDTIRNWSQHKGYLGGVFTICAVESEFVQVEPPNAINRQHIRRGEFAKVYDHWGAYNSGRLPRNELRDITRFSTYVISILHHLIDGH